jgi:hypothetical protein
MEELFNLVKNYGYIVRSNELDGLQSWNEIKYILSTISCDRLEWSMTLKDLKSETLNIESAYIYVHCKLNMKGEETDPKGNNWEKYHFFLQLVRIPKKNPKCDLVRLCQIAYNLGQLSAVYEDDVVYTENVKRFYVTNNLDKMSTYVSSSACCVISEENLESIRKHVECKMVGSGYLHKYKKYKKKYLQKK